MASEISFESKIPEIRDQQAENGNRKISQRDILASELGQKRLSAIAETYDRLSKVLGHRNAAVDSDLIPKSVGLGGNFDSLDLQLKHITEAAPSQLTQVLSDTFLKYVTEEAKKDIAEGRLDTTQIKYKHLRSINKQEEDEIFSIFLLDTISRIYDDCMEDISGQLQRYDYSLDSILEHKFLEINFEIQTYASTSFIGRWNNFIGRVKVPSPMSFIISTYDMKEPKIKFNRQFIFSSPDYRLQGISDRNKFRNRLAIKKFNGQDARLNEKFAKQCAIDLDNIKLYAYAAKQLKKGIDELSEEEIQAYQKPFNNQKLKADWIKDEVKQVSSSERKKGKKRKPKKKHTKAKRTTQSCPKEPAKAALSEMQRTIIKLNKAPQDATFSVHDRVLRWQHYEGDAFQRDRHNLCGIARLVEEGELCEKLSLPYTWRNGDRNQQGRVFFVEMIKGSEKKFGCLNVAIGRENNEIFHAMFRELHNVTLPKLQEALQVNHDAELPEAEIPWKQVSDFSYQMDQDEKYIELHVGKEAEDRVIFRFHSPSIGNS